MHPGECKPETHLGGICTEECTIPNEPISCLGVHAHTRHVCAYQVRTIQERTQGHALSSTHLGTEEGTPRSARFPDECIPHPGACTIPSMRAPPKCGKPRSGPRGMSRGARIEESALPRLAHTMSKSARASQHAHASLACAHDSMPPRKFSIDDEISPTVWRLN